MLQLNCSLIPVFPALFQLIMVETPIHKSSGWRFNGWQILLIVVLCLGIFFRFANLNQKVYSVDEVRSFLRISGYTSLEFTEKIFNGQIHTAAEVFQYQTPNSERNLGDAIKALAGNPEHPPLYYLGARFFTQIFNHPVGGKYLAAFLSLLIFPCAYWLCLELFNSSLVGWILVALIAVSPLHISQAQEARQYSLWAVVTLFSTWALLQALRTQKIKDWGLYTLGFAVGIYSHLFFVLVAVSHAVYVLIEYRKNFRQSILPYLGASLVGSLAFLPWVWVVVSNLARFQETTSWIGKAKPNVRQLVQSWLFNFSLSFVDFDWKPSFKNPLVYLILLLIGAAIFTLVRTTHHRVWLLVLGLITIPILGQMLPDLIFGGKRSMIDRYLLPGYLGIQVAVAYLFAHQFSQGTETGKKQKLWQILFAIVVSLGVASGAMRATTQSWGVNASTANLLVSPAINQAESPVVITDASHTFVLPLSYLLKPDVKLQMFDKDQLESLPVTERVSPVIQQSANVFLYYPSPKLLEMVEKDYNRRAKEVVGAYARNRYGGRGWLYQLETPGN